MGKICKLFKLLDNRNLPLLPEGRIGPQFSLSIYCFFDNHIRKSVILNLQCSVTFHLYEQPYFFEFSLVYKILFILNFGHLFPSDNMKYSCLFNLLKLTRLISIFSTPTIRKPISSFIIRPMKYFCTWLTKWLIYLESR